VGSRVGKLVKKSNEKVMKMLDMESYPWLHFNEQSIIFPDNVKKTVILEKMHDPLEISEKVQIAKEFEKPFAEKSKPLIPRDMTEDYKKGQREMVKRRRRSIMNEEEAMALELAEIEHSEEIKIDNKIKKNQQKKQVNDQNKFTNFNPNKSEEVNEKKENIEEKKVEIKPQMEQKPIENINKPNEIDQNQIELKLKEAKEEGFSKGHLEGFEKGEKEGREEGFKKGYEEGNSNGFRTGEERGLIASESKFDRAFSNISEAAIRMDKLKISLIEEGKDIFLELAKLCCERILREQIKVSDSSLIKLFDEVLKSFSATSSLSIQMNPSDAIRIKKHLESMNENSRIQIKENNALEIGSFQIENDTGASLVDIKKNVDHVIQNIKSELFKDINNESDKNEKENFELKKAI
jgi:flagellar assembly protein FliH